MSSTYLRFRAIAPTFCLLFGSLHFLFNCNKISYFWYESCAEDLTDVVSVRNYYAQNMHEGQTSRFNQTVEYKLI